MFVWCFIPLGIDSSQDNLSQVEITITNKVHYTWRDICQ